MNKINEISTAVSGVPIVLYDGEHIQLIHIPGHSAYTLLTFDIMHAKANGTSAFASGLAQSRNINFFGIVPKHPCWYPHQETKEALAILTALKDRPTIVYGASMGGYGTLKYGKAAGGDVAIALGPQATINGAVCGKVDQRYHKFYDKALHGHGDAMRVAEADLCETTIIGVDPEMDKDAFQTSLMPESEKINIVPLTYMGHKCAKAMTPSAHCVAIFETALAGKTDEVATLMRQNRDQSLEYFIGLAAAMLAAGDAKAAEAKLAEGIDRHGWSKEAALVRAEIMTGLGRPEDGLADVKAVAERQPHVPKFRVALANQLLAMGDYKAAVAELDSACASDPKPFLMIKLAKMQRAAGDNKAAAATITRALELWPNRTGQLGNI